jgi:hypothetical protein
MSPNWQEMEALLDRLERLGDPGVREDARALVGLLMRLHGDALARLLEMARAAGQEALLGAWKDDPRVGGLLLLHGLHPDDLASRVRQALAEPAPLAAFLGVAVSVRRVSEEEVVLALAAAPDVPPAALAELRGRMEAAVVRLAPEVQAVRFEPESRRVGLHLLGQQGGAAP